jgi:hypothetical protein
MGIRVFRPTSTTFCGSDEVTELGDQNVVPNFFIFSFKGVDKPYMLC